ncbi:MAG: lipoyl(octanoyl) transferase LipB [Bdellovibrionales bacterium]|nr:lipoyl(octanoyl) transferase LipB [Bdellovibrionales bacterium]
MIFKDLGELSYEKTWQLQESTRQNIQGGRADSVVFFVEHPPTMTLGRGEDGSNIESSRQWLKNNGFDVVETNRGGKVTYHGPGQLVVYPVIDLRLYHLGVKDYVHCLEDIVIDLLAQYQIQAYKRDDLIGVWVGVEKIASIGIHVSRHVSIHGMALNVSTNLSHFGYITPCGLQDVQMTSMHALGCRAAMLEIKKKIQEIFLSRMPTR